MERQLNNRTIVNLNAYYDDVRKKAWKIDGHNGLLVVDEPKALLKETPTILVTGEYDRTVPDYSILSTLLALNGYRAFRTGLAGTLSTGRYLPSSNSAISELLNASIAALHAFTEISGVLAFGYSFPLVIRSLINASHIPSFIIGVNPVTNFAYAQKVAHNLQGFKREEGGGNMDKIFDSEESYPTPSLTPISASIHIFANELDPFVEPGDIRHYLSPQKRRMKNTEIVFIPRASQHFLMRDPTAANTMVMQLLSTCLKETSGTESLPSRSISLPDAISLKEQDTEELSAFHEL